MKRISSRDNPVFRNLRRLVEQPARRHADGVAVLEGIHLCDAYLKSDGPAPRQVIAGERALDNAEVVDLIDRADAGASYVLGDGLFASLSAVEHGVPLLMVVDEPRPVRPSCITRTSVFLDRVQDPGNVGSILRSAAAAGIGDVYCARGCASAWSTKVLRAAMGAHFHLQVFEDCDLVDLVIDPALPSIATSSHAASSIFEHDLSGDVVWMFGHEGQGVDPALMREARTLRIPQPGSGESLNVAAAAAVCFFEQVRQRGTRAA